jgi:hypothetical protein
VAPATAAVSSQESATTGVATSLNVTHPTGLANGDLVVIVAEAVRGGGGAITWTGPTGFSQLGTDQALSSGTIELTVWVKDITNAAGEGTWTVSVSYGGTAPTTANLAAIAARITGAEAASGVTANFTVENVAVASFTPPSISISDNDTLVICGAVAARPGTWTSPSGYTELADIPTTGNAAASESALCMADGDALEAAGTEAPGAFTYSQTRQGISYTIAVGPAAGGVTGTAAGVFGALAGAVTGTRVALGTVAGNLGGLSGAVSGTRIVYGTAAGNLGALVGAAVSGGVSGTAAGNLGSLVGAVVGTRVSIGVVAGSFGALTGSASGTRVVLGVTAGSLGGLTGAGVGVRVSIGTAAGSFSFTGSATGTRVVAGVAAGVFGALVGAVVSGPVTNNTHGPVTLALLHSARLADSPHEAAVSTRHAAGRLHV